jgi:DNA-binding CsgD family transcriptional regulator
MSKSAVDAERLKQVASRLGEVAIDPTIWPDVMEQISAAAGARGAVLLQGDSRTPDVPRTAGVDECIRSYFSEGWHLRDIRAERSVPLMLRGARVVTDQDIVTPEDMRRIGLYADSLARHGLQWFAGIGFWAGAAHWGLTIQRTPQEGPFDRHDKRIFAGLSRRLTETATLSQAVGRVALSSATNALDMVRQPALALDRSGFVLESNASAEQLFDEEIRVTNRRLILGDRRARAALSDLIDRLGIIPDTAALPAEPIVVQRATRRPLLIRVLPIDGAARNPFLGARVLLVFSDLARQPEPRMDVLAKTFGLSPAEAKLASLMAGGISLEQAADELKIARDTARNQLKAVFAKTTTHRQGELVALLARLG